MKVIDLLNEIYLEKIKNKVSFIVKSKSTFFESPRIIYTIENNEIISLEGYNFFERLQRVYKLDDEIEIIEEEKDIEELPLLGNPEVIHRKDSFISSLLTRNNLDHNEIKIKINELVRELNKIKKEGK